MRNIVIVGDWNAVKGKGKQEKNTQSGSLSIFVQIFVD